MCASDEFNSLESSLVCNMCGKTLLLEEDVRYIVRIQVFAAPDPMEISDDDLARDLEREMQQVIKSAEGKSARELEDEVYREFLFHLCPACQKIYLRHPLPRIGE